jgi:hypothetical protein
MKPLGELLLDDSNDRFDEFYAIVRDALWEAVSKRVRERGSLEDNAFVDPLKIDLADVLYFARPIVLEIVGDMVNSPVEDAHEGLARQTQGPEHQPRQGVPERPGSPRQP